MMTLGQRGAVVLLRASDDCGVDGWFAAACSTRYIAVPLPAS
jgi:hypothetical protein